MSNSNRGSPAPVDRRAVGLSEQHFRRHIVGRSHLRLRLIPVVRVVARREPEDRESKSVSLMSLLVDQHVVGLQIAVDDAQRAVEVLEAKLISATYNRATSSAR